jgi:asparagine synthase (glutamine-hydrolysing)
MSAITAIYHRDGRPVDRLVSDQMLAILAHRGSDTFATWCGGNVALGHGMFWTTPESLTETLPLSDEPTGFVVTADARIDNRDEVLDVLSLKGRPTEIADSQLILAAYKKWGENCPEKLVGDFAFAIWDRQKQTVFCARDQLGVKPLYYFLADDLFVLASEIKALFCVEAVPYELNENRVADHLLGIFEDKAETFYRDIFRLVPAHTMTVGRSGKRVRRYWSLDPFIEIRLGSDQEHADAFREVFTAVVRSRLRSSYPVGSALSGGLDSSSIACTARMLIAKDHSRNLHTYSAIFPGLPEEDLVKIDERKFVDAVLALPKFEPHFVQADQLNPLGDLERVLWHQDETFLAPNLYMHWALYGAAQRDGVRVFLDGLDGDTTVSHGVDYLSELARKGKFWTLMREATELSKRSSKAYYTSRRIAWEYGIRNLFPTRIERLARKILGRHSNPVADIDGLINASFGDRMNVAERASRLSDYARQRQQTAREAHCENIDSGLIPYTLELADKASAAFGVEARYPFFDRRLIEFCVALPANQKLKRGWTRSIMRRAMTGILPPEVQWRVSKANLSPNFRRRLLGLGKPMIEDIIINDSGVLDRYVNISALQAAYERYSAQPMRSGSDGLTVYNAVMLGWWLRMSGFARNSEPIFKRPLAGPVASASQAINKHIGPSRRVQARGGD